MNHVPASIAQRAPGVIGELADVIGLADAAELAGEYAGRRLYVPAKFPADHRVVQLIGEAAASRLADYYFQTTITFPLGIIRRQRAIALALSQPALSYGDIAARVGAHERSVARWIAEFHASGAAPLPSQLDLFAQRG